MKKMAAFVLLLSCFCISNAQMDIGAISDSLVKEGKTLYKSEMASWNGTDIFLGKYKNRENVGGYFSYSIGDTSRCIFFSKGLSPTVIGCIYFDETFDVNKAIVDLSERVFTKNEEDLFIIRKTALTEINTDTLFKSYNNANLNLIPLISGGEKMVYVLTGPTVNGVIIFGNDYLLNFN